MQQQRLRNGLGAGHLGNGKAIGPMQMQMMQNRLRNGQAGFGGAMPNLPNR